MAVGDLTLEPGETANRIPASSNITFDVVFQNQGENDEQDVTVQIRIEGDGEQISARKRVEQTKAGAQVEVAVPLAQAPPIGTPVTITSTVAKVPGEEKTDNNTPDVHGDLHAVASRLPVDGRAEQHHRRRRAGRSGARAGRADLGDRHDACSSGACGRRSRSCSATPASATSSRTPPSSTRPSARCATTSTSCTGRSTSGSPTSRRGSTARSPTAALVRFDAYNEMSGRQSTSIALLDAHGSGLVLTSIHHRDQARVYAKQVTEGRGELELAPEEEEAVRIALSTPAEAPSPS